jgi:hypothetical protein
LITDKFLMGRPPFRAVAPLKSKFRGLPFGDLTLPTKIFCVFR